ncbi:putative PEP-binding protein [Geminocystis sp. NIES-3708]|uniref:putative PEP-binding protein n=1 Tax=Geminocystis sp. NIES-3708 TaxID=1615909 RepID=UPI0011874633
MKFDRDSSLIADIFDEHNQAVKYIVEMVIQTVKGNDRKIVICGQTLSDYLQCALMYIIKTNN